MKTHLARSKSRNLFLRRIGAWSGCAAIALTIVAAGVNPASAAMKHKAPAVTMSLTVGEATTTVPAVPSSTIDVAGALGYYRRNGLNVTIDRFSATPTVIAAMESGAVDVGYIDTTSTLELVGNKLFDVKAIDSPETGNDFLIAANNSITSVSQLAGKSFGVSAAGGSDEVDSELVLQHFGVPFSSVSPVTLGAPATRALSLAKGQVSATTMSIATWETVVGSGPIHILVTPAQYAKDAPIVSKVDVASYSTIKKKSKELLAFTKAIMEASRYESKHPLQWVSLDAPLSGDSVAQLTTAVPYFVKDWCANGCIETGALGETETYIYANTSALTGVPLVPLDDWVDTYFTKTALKDIGRDPGYN